MRLVLRHIVGATALLAIAQSCLGQLRPGEEIAPGPNDLNEQQARDRAKAFFEAAGIAAQGNPKASVLRIDRRFKHSWQLTYPGFNVEVQADDGLIGGFERVFDRTVTAKPRTGSRFFTSDDQARDRITAIAARLGLPANSRIDELSVRDDRPVKPEEGDPKLVDREPNGWVYARFTQDKGGYRFLRGANWIVVRLDIQDGSVVEFYRDWNTIAASATKSIEATTATRLGQTAYTAYCQAHHRTPRGTATESECELGFVVPNGEFSSENMTRVVPRPARLGYIVHLGKDEVWIDADSGAVIGGRLVRS